jgi:zinc protease
MMLRACLIALLFVALGVTRTHAAPRPSLPTVSFEKHVLANGLELILHVDKKLPLAHVNLWYHVGAKNEAPGKTGFAHLFEHLMLQGSKNAPEDYFTLMARAGAKGGRDANGTTSHDRTNYFATAPSGSLEYLLWVHADLLATMPDALTLAKLNNQRDVVRNERRQGLENTPYGRRYKLVTESLFPAGHPYAWSIIGSHEDLANASLDDVKSFFRSYYTPNNLSLVVSGDFDPAEAKRLVEKYFGSIAPGPALERPRHDIPRLSADKVIDVHERVAQPRVLLAWVAPEAGAAGARELALTANILTEGLSARLQKALVYNRKLCTQVQAYFDAREIAGVFVVDAIVRPGTAITAVEQLIAAEIASLAKRPPTVVELERARTQTLTRLTSSLQSIGARGVSEILNYYNVFFGDPEKLAWDLQGLLAVTPESLRATVSTWLANAHHVSVRFRPEQSVRSGGAEPDRSKVPALGADARFRVPAVASRTLPNGLELLVVERRELPIVSAALVSRAGSVLDPKGKEGLATLVGATMQRGTHRRTALAIADTLGDLGTSLNTDVALERAVHELEVQKEHLPSALAILASIARSPTFSNAELERERKLQLDLIEQVEADPTRLGHRLRAQLAFGADHPYGRPSLGFRASVSSLTAADAVAFHRDAWSPRSAALILVGDISVDQAAKAATATFGLWSGEATAPIAIPTPAPAARGKIVLVDKPDAAQTVFVQLYSAPQQKGDDYYGVRLASEVLGSNASGRLYANLRQDKGYAYVASSWLQTFSSGMVWSANGSVQTDKTRESVVELVKEMRGVAGARPIAARELEDARLGLIRNYAAGFGTNLEVARRIADLWSKRWSLDELMREPEELQRASLASVQAAAKRYALPAESALLLVGDRSKIEGPVRALALGEVVVVDAFGKPLSH